MPPALHPCQQEAFLAVVFLLSTSVSGGHSCHLLMHTFLPMICSEFEHYLFLFLIIWILEHVQFLFLSSVRYMFYINLVFFLFFFFFFWHEEGGGDLLSHLILPDNSPSLREVRARTTVHERTMEESLLLAFSPASAQLAFHMNI